MKTETQSIIVYRNPLEKAIWESDAIGYVAGGLAVIITLILLGTLAQAVFSDLMRVLRRFRK